jgi:hypothetical protein
MMRPPHVSDRYTRALAAIHGYGILGTSPEPEFDIFPALCCAALDAPSAFLTFFDGDEMWTKAEAGTLRPGRAMRQGPLRETFDSAHTIHVTGADGFFCGAPVYTPEHVAIGAIGVFDDRPRDAGSGMLQAIRTIATAVTYALEARKRLIPAAPVLPGKPNLYAVSSSSNTASSDHCIEAVLSKIEAGRRLLRAGANDVATAEAFAAAMQQLAGDNDEPHVLVVFSAPGRAADELVAQARRARLLCDHDLAAFIRAEYVAMLLRDVPVTVGRQAVKRFADAQLNTTYRVEEVRGPLANARELLDSVIERLHRRR